MEVISFLFVAESDYINVGPAICPDAVYASLGLIFIKFGHAVVQTRSRGKLIHLILLFCSSSAYFIKSDFMSLKSVEYKLVLIYPLRT